MGQDYPQKIAQRQKSSAVTHNISLHRLRYAMMHQDRNNILTHHLRHRTLKNGPSRRPSYLFWRANQPQHVYLAHRTKTSINAVLVVTPPVTHQIVVLPVLFRPPLELQPEVAVPLVDRQQQRPVHGLQARLEDLIGQGPQVVVPQGQHPDVAETREDVLVDLADFVVVEQHRPDLPEAPEGLRVDRLDVVVAQVEGEVPGLAPVHHPPLDVLEGQRWQLRDVVGVEMDDRQVRGVVVPAVVDAADEVEAQIQLVDARHVIESHRVDHADPVTAQAQELQVETVENALFDLHDPVVVQIQC